MTQEELDALMNEDIEMDGMDTDASEPLDDALLEGLTDEITSQKEDEINFDDDMGDDNPSIYRVEAMKSWPPPPPTDDNKMVHQLDDVTKESEEKASEIFDLIEGISNDLQDQEKTVKTIRTTIESNIALFKTLREKFPNVDAFGAQLEKNETVISQLEEVLEMLQNGGDTIMNVMDIMQYQDIHRQKIERVINVMRALSTYMNHLFASKLDDSKRVASAVHIHGDVATEDVVTSDDIEALLASFGKK